jgi:hypothetical protein
MELMAIAAVEVGSNIHRKLLDDLEKEKKKTNVTEACLKILDINNNF